MKTTHKETTKKSEKINTQIWKVRVNEEVKQPKDYLTIAVIIALLGLMVVFNSAIGIGEAKRESKYYEKNKELEMVLMKRQKSVDYVLLTYADDYETAYRICECESQLGKYRDNWEGSGATGLFQFKPETFDYFCEGNINSDIAQTKCFNKLYPRYSHYWECQ